MSIDFDRNILQNLLDKIALLIKHDEKVKAEKQRRGENFNVFTVLGFYSEEVKLHSAFIAELLNVEGSHGLKDTFLKSFMQYAGIGDLTIDTSKCKTTVELSIGQKTETTGGRIDIIIETPEAAIIIENKIYARDQENQLMRYCNYAKSKNYKNGFKLIYLTLNGNEPVDFTTGGKEIQEGEITCISYRDTILNWLNQSVEIAANQPLVRETIKQYIAVIKKLTGQNIENEHMDELMKILSENKETIKASFLIHDNLERLRRHILLRVKQFQKEIMDEINISKKFVIIDFTYDDDYDEKESGYSFFIKSWNNHKIKFSFAEKWYGGFYYGIVNKTEKETLTKEHSKMFVNRLNGYHLSSNVWWTCNKQPDDPIYRNNWGMETIVNIATTDDFKKLMKDEILNLLAATEGFKM